MTANPPSIIDREAFSVRRSVTISADVRDVWDAITQPEKIAQWFGQTASLSGIAVGAEGVFGFDGYGEFPVVVEGLDPGRWISYRWGNDNARPMPLDPDRSTVFTFTLEPTADGTILTVVETGFATLPDPDASLEGNRSGWDSELDELVDYLERLP